MKTKKGNFVNAKNRPMTSFEEVLVFSKANTANGSKNKMKYNPQGLIPFNKTVKNGESKFGTMAGKRPSHQKERVQKFTNYPQDVLYFDSVGKTLHPTHKPEALMEYLIRTYTDEGDTVLDSCAGSGSTLIAAMNANRSFIGIEKEKEYYDLIVNRIAENKVRLENSEEVETL